MRIALTLLGLDLFTIEVNTDAGDNDSGPGDCTTAPIGFAPSPGDQRWEKGAGGGEL